MFLKWSSRSHVQLLSRFERFLSLKTHRGLLLELELDQRDWRKRPAIQMLKQLLPSLNMGARSLLVNSVFFD